MKKIAKFGVVALLLVGLVTSVFAFSGRGFGNEAAKQAIESGNFASWKSAMTADLTQERFDQIRTRHQDMDTRRAQMEEKRADMDASIEAGYAEWKSAVEGTPQEHLLETINEDNFNQFAMMHQARIDGDFDTANQIADELGLAQGGFGRHGGRMGNCPFD